MASKPHDWADVAGRRRATRSNLSNAILTRAGWVWKPLVYSSTYLALIAVAEVLVVRHLLSLPPSPAPLVGALITFAVYANDRLVDLETDAESNPKRTAFVRRHPDTLYVLGALAYGIAVALSVLGGPVSFAVALLPGAAWVLYAVDWVPLSDAPFRRLKEIAILNSAVVAVAWSLPLVLLPLAFGNATVGSTAVVVFLYFMLATFVNAEIANVGDVESDRQSGDATLPVVLGIARTRQTLYGVVALTGALLALATAGGHLTPTAAAVLSVGLAALLGVIALVGRVDNDDFLGIAAECTRLPVFLILVVSGVGL